MRSVPASSSQRWILIAVVLLTIVPVTLAQTTFTWTGASTMAQPNLWTNTDNWTPPGPPGVSDTALFSGTTPITSIALGGPQPINTISFASTPAAYTLGVLSSGDAFNFDPTNGGTISIATGTTTAQTINASASYAALTITNSGTGGLILNGAMSGSGVLTLNGTGLVTFKGVVSGAGSVTISGAGPVALNAANTYTGGTLLSGAGPGIRLGISTDTASNSTFTSGPFGTGTVTFMNANPPILEPFGADRTIANAITLVNGFFAQNPTAAQDPTGLHNLTLSGPITLGTTGRVSTNDLSAGVALTLGLPGANASTLTLGAQLTIQSQVGTAGANGGITIVNDVVQNGAGTGALVVQNNATVVLNNTNTYTGATTVTSAAATPGGKLFVNGTNSGAGAVNVRGTGSGGAASVGIGGILGGTGSIAGLITISTTTAASQGGNIDPGPGGATPGTLTVGSMTWNPFGRYVFAHNANDTTTGAGVNNFINGSGTLNLTNLGNIVTGSPSATPFDLNLQPVNFAATPVQQNYIIATFAGGITGTVGGTANQPIPTGTDISNLFTVSGAFMSIPTSPTPFATVIAGPGGGASQSIQLTFTPVPEPMFVLAACGGLTALVAWRTRRRAGTGRQLHGSAC